MRRKPIKLVVSFLLVTLVLAAVFYRQTISDSIRLLGYTPPEEIATLADNTTMLPSSRRLFYVHRPIVTEKNEFNTYCRDHGNEYTIVLGCYRQNGGIYLLNVTDERLNGIKEVTAAHELLHAAYDRLSSNDKEQINQLLLQLYAQIEDDRIKQTIEQYREQDPAVVPNELHSIIGSEVRNLSPELEKHYGQYFDDRLKVVSYSEQYEQAFLERRNQIREYDNQLESLKSQIDSLEAQLKQTDEELQIQRQTMNNLKNRGEIEAYNAQVPLYNAKVNRYNADIDELSSLIVQYNTIVQKRNAIAAEEAELVEAIDSREVVPEQQ